MSLVYAIADQGAFAASNFFLNLLLARSLSKAAFAEFSFAYACFFFLSSLYGSLVLDPMLVFGSKYEGGQRAFYLAALARLHLLAAGATSGFLLLFSIVSLLNSADSDRGLSLMMMAAAAPFILDIWYQRRKCYLLGSIHSAAVAGALHALLTVALIALLSATHHVNLPSAYLAVAASGLAVSLVMRMAARHSRVPTNSDATRVWVVHLNYARWAAAAALLGTLPTHLYTLVLTSDVAADYRAIMILVTPATQAAIAVSPVLVRSFSRLTGDPAAWRLAVVKSLCGGLGFGLAFILVCALIGRHALAIVYSGKYDASAPYLIFFAAYAVLYLTESILSCALRSKGSARGSALMNGTASLVTVLLIGMISGANTLKPVAISLVAAYLLANLVGVLIAGRQIDTRRPKIFTNELRPASSRGDFVSVVRHKGPPTQRESL